MQRRKSIEVAAVAVGLVAMAAGVFAQQAPAGRGAAPAAPQGQAQGEGRGRGAAPAAAAAAPATVPALMFKEIWKQPPYTGTLNDENRRVTQAAVTNPQLELKLYGAAVKEVGVYEHEGRFDLWTGMSTSPVALMLRDKGNLIDLTGLARLRATVRTQSLHLLYPALKLADGTYVAGSRGVNTEGNFIHTEIAFNGQRWFKLDPEKLVTTVEVMNPDLSKVDEVGFVDLMPSGGHGNAGWANVSTVELYAKPVKR